MAEDMREGGLLRMGKVKSSETGKVTDGLVWNLFGETAEKYFREYVRNIEGITVDGVQIKRPGDMLDPSVGNNDFLGTFYAAVLDRFLDINVVLPESEKNSEGQPAASGEKS
jgi:hypothetical protein